MSGGTLKGGEAVLRKSPGKGFPQRQRPFCKRRSGSTRFSVKGGKMHARLGEDLLPSIGPSVSSCPTYDRKKLELRQVHIGLGHFHRAHYLTYLDTLLCQGDVENWGVYEVDIPPSDPAFAENLEKQDYLYSVLSWGPDGSSDIRVNGPIIGYANATRDPETVWEKLTDPSVRLITLTITEKGYCYLDDSHSLDWDNPAVKADAEAGEKWAKTAVGWLSRALKKRSEISAPVTVMSCDNIPVNGKVLETCVKQFCRKTCPEILPWIEKNVAFPCTMVDRITPGTTEADKEAIEKKAGYRDECPVHCEDFIQWVIEDKKTTEIPPYAKAGAMVVKDVQPYELMKIRLLNGSHSALSYPAYLMGILAVDEAATNPLIRRFIRGCYMEEITKTLLPVPGIDVTAYKDKLISRFSNRYIADKILRLASDGSKKISNAIVKPLEEAILAGGPHKAMVYALAVWARFLEGKDEKGSPVPVDDPAKKQLMASCRDSAAFLRLIGVSRVDGKDFENLCAQLAAYRADVEKKGIRVSMNAFLDAYGK